MKAARFYLTTVGVCAECGEPLRCIRDTRSEGAAEWAQFHDEATESQLVEWVADLNKDPNEKMFYRWGDKYPFDVSGNRKLPEAVK